MRRIFEEVRCDYMAEDDHFWRVDAWRPAAEQGEVIAYIDDLTGRVLYACPEARYDSAAQEIIAGSVDMVRKNLPAKLSTLARVTGLGYDLIDRSVFLATKLWSREDIIEPLTIRGFEATEEAIDAVINTGYLNALNDCTDGDWEIIESAITEASRRGYISKK